MEKCQCTQCGSTDFAKEGKEFLRCSHCHSLFRMLEPQSTSPKLIINKGANVVFGANSRVVVNGGMKVEDGANVKFLGKLDIVEKSSPEHIEKARQHLALVNKKQI